MWSELSSQPLLKSADGEWEDRFRLLLEGVKDYDLILLDRDGFLIGRYGGPERTPYPAASSPVELHVIWFYPPEEVSLGKPLQELAAAAENGRIEREGWWRRDDGERYWAELVFTARMCPNAGLMGYSIVSRDITERTRSELALKSVVDYSSDALITIDEHGSIQSYAGSAQKIFGYAPAEVLGRNVHMLLPEPWRSEHDTYISNYLETGQAKVIGLGREVIGLRKDGVEVPLDLAITHFSLGGLRFFTGILRDISERKAVQNQLRIEVARAEKASSVKSEFLANMSHEIRTPLTAIMGYCEILRDESIREQAPPQTIQMVETIRQAGEHLLTIINDILDLSKIEAGRLSTEQVATSLPHILSEVDSLMRTRIQGKGVEFRILLESAIPDVILCDPTRLRQILLNLVGNAAKFTESGSICIRTRVDRSTGVDWLQMEVEDTGLGMTVEESTVLFKPFSQADASVTRQHGGTGLGLTISRRLARLLGGDVRLDFSIPGKGSRFVLELPLISTQGSTLVHDLVACSQVQREAVPAITAMLKGRILLAEDGEDNRRLISFQLKRAGAEVELAENGRIALEKLDLAMASGCPFDLLLTDMQMPEMDGYTLAKILRGRGTQIPIVALTAHAMAEDRQKCLDAGCDDYGSKPIKKDDLLATCRKWIEHRRSQLYDSPQQVNPSQSPLPTL